MPEDEDEWDFVREEDDESEGALDDLRSDLCELGESYIGLTPEQLHERLDALIAQEESNGS